MEPLAYLITYAYKNLGTNDISFEYTVAESEWEAAKDLHQYKGGRYRIVHAIPLMTVEDVKWAQDYLC